MRSLLINKNLRAFIIRSRKELERSWPFALQLLLKRVSSFLGERKYRILIRMRSKMHKKTCQFQGKAYKAIQDDLWSLLGKWEHRAEILTAIAREQRASGRHEMAEAYKKQAIESKKHAESVRKLLMGQTS